LAASAGAARQLDDKASSFIMADAAERLKTAKALGLSVPPSL